MLYLYALTEHPGVVPDARGIEGAPLEVEELGSVDAIFGRIRREPTDACEADVLAHARVVDELAAANDSVLPVRFGSVYHDVGALSGAVREREAELARALERIRGCRELGLRVVDVRPHSGPRPRTGREYMRALLNEQRSAEHVAAIVHEPLAALAREDVSTIRATSPLLFTATYLVSRDAVGRFQSAVTELERAHPELAFACTGPWPPYSFTAARERA